MSEDTHNPLLNTGDSSSQLPPRLEDLISQGEKVMEKKQAISESTDGTAVATAAVQRDDVVEDIFPKEKPEDPSAMIGQISARKSVLEASQPQEEVAKGMPKPPIKVESQTKSMTDHSKRLWQKVTGIFSKKAESSEVESSDNAFTKLFASKKTDPQEEGALMDTIISQSDSQQLEVKNPEEIADSEGNKRKNPLQDANALIQKEAENTTKAQELLQMAKIAAGASVLVPMLSFLLSALFLSTDGIFAKVLGEKNYGLTRQVKQEEVQRLSEDVTAKKAQHDIIAKKIENIQDNQVLAQIVQKRIHWHHILETIEDVTNKTFESNEVSRLVTYTQYSGKEDANGNVEINISGQVRNPTGKAFESLIRLKNAINEFETFEGINLTQFTKQRTAESSSSDEYVSPIRFTFDYNKVDTLKAAADEESKAPNATEE